MAYSFFQPRELSTRWRPSCGFTAQTLKSVSKDADLRKKTAYCNGMDTNAVYGCQWQITGIIDIKEALPS